MTVTQKQKTRIIDFETGEPVIQELPLPTWLINSHEELMRKRFISGTTHEYRVKNSLQLGGNSNLYAETSLLYDNQVKSASVANAFFQKKFRNLIRNEKAISSKFRKIKTEKHNHYPTDDHSVAEKRMRFLTIIHSVSALNKAAAMIDVQELIKDFKKCVKKIAGISCYAVVEAEIISYRNLVASKNYESKELVKSESIFNNYKEKEHRKLNNYEILGAHLGDEVLRGEQGSICIHLHGLITGKNKTTFDDFLNILKSNKNWKGGSRRIQLKKLSEHYLGKDKPVSLSLEHISRYILKGGTILNEGKPCLHYKINNRDDKLTTYEEYLMSESLYDECDDSDLVNIIYSKNKHSTDFLSLSRLEINVLTEVNNLMMNLNNTKTGHIIKIGY